MEHESERYAAPSVRGESMIMPRGFVGALQGITALCVILFFVGVALHTILIGEQWDRLLGVFLYVLSLWIGFCGFGLLNHLLFLLIDDLTGRFVDLRIMSVIAMTFTVYGPAAFVLFMTQNATGTLGVDLRESALVVSMPMIVASTGAWLGANAEYRRCPQSQRRDVRFELKHIFGSTLVVAVLIFLTQLIKVDIMFWIGYAAIMVPVTIVTAIAVLCHRLWSR